MGNGLCPTSQTHPDKSTTQCDSEYLQASTGWGCPDLLGKAMGNASSQCAAGMVRMMESGAPLFRRGVERKPIYRELRKYCCVKDLRMAGPGLIQQTLSKQASQASRPCKRLHATCASTYGPLGMTAIRAAGPYSASEAATAASTVVAGSTNRPARISGARPPLTTSTIRRACLTTLPPALRTEFWNRYKSQHPPRAASHSSRSIEARLYAASDMRSSASFSWNLGDERLGLTAARKYRQLVDFLPNTLLVHPVLQSPASWKYFVIY